MLDCWKLNQPFNLGYHTDCLQVRETTLLGEKARDTFAFFRLLYIAGTRILERYKDLHWPELRAFPA